MDLPRSRRSLTTVVGRIQYGKGTTGDSLSRALKALRLRSGTKILVELTELVMDSSDLVRSIHGTRS